MDKFENIKCLETYRNKRIIYINNIFLGSIYIDHTSKYNYKNVIWPSPSTIKHVDNIVHFFKFGNALITTGDKLSL